MRSNDDIVKDAKEFLELCNKIDDGGRDDALEDLKFLKGDQWDEQSVRQRELDGRPCLTVNNIPAIVRQVTNDIRQNRQSITVHPVDDGADIDVAEVIEGLIRHIEYDSGADAAYDTAATNAAQIGFGYFRLITEYCGPESFDQDIKIKRIRNPFTVYLDPASQELDGSDAKKGLITAKIPKKVFERQYKGKDTASYIPRGPGDTSWLGDDFVRVAEYYTIEEMPETLVRLSDGTARFATDRRPLPDGVYPTGETRPSYSKKVMWRKVTGVEVLEEAEIPFDWIPIFPVYGDELDIDGRVIRSGLIRNAKDPKKMENYWMTAATEEIALRTKTPYIGAMGQFEGVEEDWAAANVRSFPYLEYNPVTVDGSLAPPPQRQAPADVPSGYIAMAGLARDNVKAVTGIYDASLGNRSNETSGIAISQRQNQGEIANFHFGDNLRRTMRHLGRVILSGIPRIYDTPRVVRIVGIDGKTTEQVKINTPLDQPEVDEKTKAVKTVLNDLTVGRYDVVISTGPAYQTQREEALANMVQMGKAWPKLMDVAGDKVVRAMDWPGAEEIADRIEKTLPPGLLDHDDGNAVQTPNGPIPAEQAGQLIGQLDHTVQQMSQELDNLRHGIIKAQMDNEARIRIAEIQAQASHDGIELKGMIDMLLTKMDALQVIRASEVQHAHDVEIAQQNAALGMAQAEHQQELQPDASASAPQEEAQ